MSSASSESNYAPLFAPVISQCNQTIDKAKHLAERWFQIELNGEGGDYNSYIREFKEKIVQGIPKSIHEPTDADVLAKLNEKSTLSKLYENLTLVRNAVIEREMIAKADDEHRSDAEIFSELHNEIRQIIEELSYVLQSFDVKVPADPDHNNVRHVNSEDNVTLRKHRNWRIFHDYIVLVEFTNDVMKYLDKKYCSNV